MTPHEALLRAVNRVARNVRKGHGSFVTFDLEGEGDGHEFFVWVYLCGWRIQERGKELAHCESTDEEIHAATSRLEGLKLTSIALQQFFTETGMWHGATFFFEERLTMRLFQYEEPLSSGPDEVDTLFMVADKKVTWFCYNADGSTEVSEEDDDTTPSTIAIPDGVTGGGGPPATC